jgi:hypothetical protein
LYVLDLGTLVWSRVHGPREREGDGKGGKGLAQSAGLRDEVAGDEMEGEAWPRARYFHSMDHWNGKLVLFGGMGAVVTPTPQTTTISPTGLGSGTTVQPCVLDDLWLYDIATGIWEECVPELPMYTSSPPSPTSGTEDSGAGTGDGRPVVPEARYAHLSAVVGDQLVVIGGQEISNE